MKQKKAKRDSGHMSIKGCPRVLGELLQEVLSQINIPHNALSSNGDIKKGGTLC